MGAKLYLIGGIVLMSLGFFQAAINGAREKALERESARVVASATVSVPAEKNGTNPETE